MTRTILSAAAATCLFVSACSSLDLGLGLPGVSVPDVSMPKVSLPSFGGGSTQELTQAGLIVGDEPLAVRAGADILAQGGTAADAAVATYFALSVTYPVAAGLGGGGICLVRDAEAGTVESFDFFARDTRSGASLAVPGNARGFAMIQSLYGALPWQVVVARGERLAALGFPISRALAARLQGAADVVRLDAGLARVFMDEFGQIYGEGRVVRNPELAASLAAIRTEGPSTLYGGALGRKLADYAAGQGTFIAADEMERYAPVRTAARGAALGDAALSLPAERTGAGRFAAAVLGKLRQDGRVPGAGEVASAVNAALGDFGVTSLPADFGATGFAAVDGAGQAVACAVSMNGPFGSGRTAEGTGITFAAAPSSDDTGLAVAFLTPAIASDGPRGSLMFAGSGAGGPNGTAAVLNALARRAEGALANGQIRGTGLAPRESVNVILCRSGSCAAVPDSGGQGMGAFANR